MNVERVQDDTDHGEEGLVAEVNRRPNGQDERVLEADEPHGYDWYDAAYRECD